MVGDWVFDDFQQLLLRRSGPDGELVQQLDHETSEALEGTWYADRGRNLNEDALGCVDVDLKLASLVDGRVEECEQALARC